MIFHRLIARLLHSSKASTECKARKGVGCLSTRSGAGTDGTGNAISTQLTGLLDNGFDVR